MATGLLSGITVLDFTAAFVDPFCNRIMADMGTDVIKIERPVDNPEERFPRSYCQHATGCPSSP